MREPAGRLRDLHNVLRLMSGSRVQKRCKQTNDRQDTNCSVYRQIGTEMAWDTGLNGPALDIAKTDAKRLRVMAGPGTGKSYALKHRIMRLVEQGQKPLRIWAVTFTRNAADSLVNDLKGIEKPGDAPIHVSTLHAYCFGLLMNHVAHTGRTPRIVTATSSKAPSFEHDMLVRDLINENPEFNDGMACSKRIEALEAIWVKNKSSVYDDPVNELLEKRLNAWLDFHKAILLNELVPEALRLLRSGRASSTLTAFDHVIVDEYQDLNEAEQEIIDIVSENGSLAIVGDINQSIYSFRHAHWEGMDKFQEKHPDTCDVPLTLCWRNPTRVVKMANELIAHNRQPNAPPSLQPNPENPDGKIHAIRWNTITEEIEGIAKYVKHLTDNHICDPKDILIMVPRTKLGSDIQSVMNEQNIPVRFQPDALATYMAQRALALFTLLGDNEDRVALRWWLGQGDPENDSYQKLREYCESHNKSPWSVLEGMMHDGIELPSALSLLAQFGNLVEEIDRLSKLSLHDLVDDLLPDDNEDCAVLRDSAKLALVGSKNVRQVYQTITENIHQPKDPDCSSVRVMTMHKAKGLTSKVAIVAGCCDGLIPYQKNWIAEDLRIVEMREPRRLFYVAITRCKETLVLSYSGTADKAECDNLTMSPGAWDENKQRYIISPSPFIDELGSAAPPTIEGAEWQSAQYKQADTDSI